MPTFTVRVSHDEHGALIARAQRAGQNVSDYVRDALALREQDENIAETIRTLVERSNSAIVTGGMVDDHERRIKQLERVAGLDD